MMIDGLQTRGIFAAACEVLSDRIVAAAVIIQSSHYSDIDARLIQSASPSGESFAVHIPELEPEVLHSHVTLKRL